MAPVVFTTAFAVLGLAFAVVAMSIARAAARTGGAHTEFATEKLDALETRVITLAERVDGVLDEAKQNAKDGDDAVRASLDKALDTAQQRLTDEQQRLDSQIGTTEAKIAEVEERVQAGNETLSREIGAVEQHSAAQAQELANRAEAIEQQAAGVDGKLNGLTEELSKTDRDLRALEIDAGQIRQDIDAVDAYVKDTLQARLDAAMQAFDGTVTGVLGEMKGELLRGVNRIEEMEAVVSGRSAAHNRLLGEPDVSDQEAPEPGDEEVATDPSPSDVAEDADGLPTDV